MAVKIATGCRECNGDIANAEDLSYLEDGYCTTDMYQRIPVPRPKVLLDGMDQTGLEVVFLTNAILVRNHLRRMPDGTLTSHLCECESGYVAVEMWEGHVMLEPRNLEAEWVKIRERAIWTPSRSS